MLDIIYVLKIFLIQVSVLNSMVRRCRRAAGMVVVIIHSTRIHESMALSIVPFFHKLY